MFEESSIEIFSSRDKILDEMIDQMKDYLELESLDLSKTDYLSYLVNILSGLTANLLFYNTTTYRELFLTKAVQKDSVLSWSAMLGYSPTWATAATCSVLVAIPLKFTGDVTFTIPKGHQYKAGSIVFTQDNPIQIDIPRDEHGDIIDITVTETLTVGGSRSLKYETETDSNGNVTLYFTADITQKELVEFTEPIPTLLPYEFYELDINFDGQIASIDEVISEEWERSSTIPYYESLFLIPFDTKGYVFEITESGARISFGNGVVGQQPPSGSIDISLYTTEGASGNVIAGSINRTDKLYVKDYNDSGNSEDSQGKFTMRTVSMEVVNVVPATGGRDFPTVDEIRTSAIANVTAMNRLVSETDFSNIESIVTELPVNHTISVLKRSDLKGNEISLFTDIIFEETIVPTRNTKWDVTDSTSSGYVYIQTKDTITIDGSDYYSMFNIEIDPINEECTYYYLASELEKSVTLNRTRSGLTTILPSYATFTVVTTDSTSGDLLSVSEQYVDIELNFDILETDAEDGLQCILETSWDGTVYNMVQEVNDDGNTVFTIPTSNPLLLSSIPDMTQTYLFKMYYLDGGEVDLPYLTESQVSLILKQQLDEFMYSQVHVDSTNSYRVGDTISVYDVPVIKKSYYDGIDQNSFALQIYNDILTLDITEYRMTNDFINLKFSDTTGVLDNMKYNQTTKNPVISVNPTGSLSSLGHGSGDDENRYLVTDSEYISPWGEDSTYDKDAPFIAEYVASTDSWIFERVVTNDIINVTSLNDNVLYDGNDAVIPILTIPFTLQLIVWRDTSVSATTDAIVQNVKNNLIDGLYSKFGFDSNIYLSEIIEIVQNVEGVRNCTIVEPTHDVFFDYDLKEDLTQAQLLEYSPQLVWFDSTTISVEIR
jgi:uncharacterized LabA/DUF88 family protein